MSNKNSFDKRGSVSIVAAVLFTVLIGLAGLVTEYGLGLATRQWTQQVADASAYSGALAYSASPTSAALNAAVNRIATLNGLNSTQVAASVVGSPRGDGNNAVLVTVSANVPLVLSQVLSSTAQLSVSATSYVELVPAVTAGTSCIIALSTSGTGVTLSGSNALTATSCAVASNNTVSVPCGTSLTAPTVNYDSISLPSEPCGGITGPSGTAANIAKTLTADPLSSNPGIAAAIAHISTVAAMTSPSGPTVSTGGNIAFGTSVATTQAQATADGCSALYSSSTWTLTCPGSGPFNFGNITTSSGITVNFNTGGPSSATYNFSGSIQSSGTAMTFGPGTYNVAKGIYNSGSTLTFNAGTYNVGIGATPNCNGAGITSICNASGTMTFNGPDTFVVAEGVHNSGTMTMGAGSTSNSYTIGAATGTEGAALYGSGGASITTLGDATGAGSVFQLAGNIIEFGTPSCMTLGAAAAHDVNGNILTAGGTILGAGTYTFNQYVSLGGNGGGTATCNGVATGISGASVNLVIAATVTPASGSCAGTAFCVASGYSLVTLAAPTSGSLKDVLVIGPHSSTNTAGSYFTDATSTALSGVFYTPNGPFTADGSATIGSGADGCLQVVASAVSLGGGSALASSCTSMGGTSAARVLLVQ